MKFRFFAISALDPQPGEEEVNRFCAGHRVFSVERQFAAAGQSSFWSLCVGYRDEQTDPPTQRRGKVDYKEVLNASDFALFVKLRNLRKTLADQEGVPAFALFTNEQLAELVLRRVATRTQLSEISGVGPARVEKYGDAFIGLVRAEPLPPVATALDNGKNDETGKD